MNEEEQDEEEGWEVEGIGGGVIGLAEEAEAQEGVVPVDGFGDGEPIGGGKGGDEEEAVLGAEEEAEGAEGRAKNLMWLQEVLRRTVRPRAMRRERMALAAAMWFRMRASGDCTVREGWGFRGFFDF